MPGRKPSVSEWTTALDEVRRHQGVVLEEMRSQNRATIEAVAALDVSVNQRLEHMQKQKDGEFAVVHASIRGLAAQIREADDGSRARDESLGMSVRELKVAVLENGVELRAVAGRVESLARLEDRVTALEKRSG